MISPKRMTRAQLLSRNPVVKALGARRIPDKMWRELSMAAHISLEEAMRGVAKADHRDALASVVNTMMVVAERHCTQESVATVCAAREAIFRADARYGTTGRWLLDGQGIQELKDAIAGQDDMTRQLGIADITDAILTADDRLARQMAARH